MVAMSIKTNCMGNVVVSLFWEEKFLLVIRYIQLYGFLMIAFYESWPTEARRLWSYVMLGSTGSFHLIYDYYGTIQSFAAF